MNDHRLFLYENKEWVFKELYLESDFGTERGSQIKGVYECPSTGETREHVFSCVECLAPNISGLVLEQRAVYSLLKGLSTKWNTEVQSRYSRLYTVRSDTAVCRVYVKAPRHTVLFKYEDDWTRVTETTQFSTIWLDGASNTDGVTSIESPFPVHCLNTTVYQNDTSSTIYERILSILTGYLK